MNVFDVWTMEYGEAESDTKGGRKKKLGKKGGLTSPLYGKKLLGLKLAKIGMM